LKSSWTIGGEEVPFVPYKYPPRFGLQFAWKSITRQDFRFEALYLNSITDSERADKAVIAVERINGPILLISVGDDAWWPSSLFTNMIVKRLQEHRFAYEVKRLDYPGAGHFLSVPYVPTMLLQFNGGTPKINAAAIEDAWRNILAFLNQNLD
jgi:dienelactone hydrolase